MDIKQYRINNSALLVIKITANGDFKQLNEPYQWLSQHCIGDLRAKLFIVMAQGYGIYGAGMLCMNIGFILNDGLNALA